MRTVNVLLASAVLGAASLPAAAQVAAPASGNGSLVFIGFDAVRGTSLFENLNLTLDDVQPGTFTSGNFVLSGYSSAFGASNAGDIRWMVVAGDSDGFGGAPNYSGEQYDSLRLAATTLNSAPVQSNIGLEAGLANLEDFTTLRVNGAACGGVSPCVGTSAADARYAGVLGGQLNGLSGGAAALNFNTLGTITDTLNFFLFGGTGGSPQTASVRTAYSGLFSLGGGTLTFAGTTTVVPLPAGVWLLLSGLAGMVTVARRRNALANDALPTTAVAA